MKMGAVDSEAIKAVGFSGDKGESGTLKIQFTNGKSISYKEVSYDVYRKLVLSKSHGSFYNEHIRGKFKAS